MRRTNDLLSAFVLGLFSFLGVTPMLWAQGLGTYGLAVESFRDEVLGSGAGRVLDIATANAVSDDLSICPGDGKGAFACIRNISLRALGGTEPHVVLAADFNGDRYIDLAVANFMSDNVFILIGDGTGRFLYSEDRVLSVQRPAALVAGDFDRDRYRTLDLAVVSQTTNAVLIFLGNGDGTFGPPRSYSVGMGPSSIAAGDFNGDGILDLAVANGGSNNISVLLGNMDGTFRGAGTLAVGTNPQSIITRDFNGDNCLDLATANSGANTVSVLLGNRVAGRCNGTFAMRSDFNVGQNPQSITAGDFDLDGVLDLASANFSANTVSVLLGNGDGSFAAAQPIAVGDGPRTIIAADFDNDGILDLATANQNSNNFTVLIGDGNGAFTRRDCRGDTCQ